MYCHKFGVEREREREREIEMYYYKFGVAKGYIVNTTWNIKQ